MASNSLLVSLCNGSNVTITTRYFPTSPSYWCAFIYLAAYLKQHTRDGSEASWASPGLINLVSGGKCITQAGVNQMQKTELAWAFLTHGPPQRGISSRARPTATELENESSITT